MAGKEGLRWREFLRKVAGIVLVLSLIPTLQAFGSSGSYTFALDWVVYGRHAPYYVALDKGFYAARGLNIEIVRGYGSYDTIKRVGMGEAVFGFADMGALVIARSEGIKVKCVGMVYHKAPYALFSLARTGIAEPKDLEGHSIAATAGEAPRKMFPVFAELNGIDVNKITWLIVAPEAKTPMLLAGKADVVAEYVLTRPVLSKLATEQGEEITEILMADYGLDIYSNGLIVSDDFARENPDVVRRFVEATFEGFTYTFAHPEEAVEILLKYKPILEKDIALAEIAILRELMLISEEEKPQPGWMDETKVRKTIETVSRAYELAGNIDPSSIYTNDYVAHQG